MKVTTYALCFLFAFTISCGVIKRDTTPKEFDANNNSKTSARLSEETVISIAKKEAIKEEGVTERELADKYDFKIVEETEAWRIEFQNKDITTKGRGLMYFIDKETGKILERQYYQ